MFIPLNDDNPLRVIRFQFVAALIIVLNVVFFIFTGTMGNDSTLLATAVSFGVVPLELLQGGVQLIPVDGLAPEPLTLLTYMFLHGGWMHLIGNMAFLWVFADNVEDAFNHWGFAIFFVLCGIAGALAHALMMPESRQPLIGASGAVSGVLAAYMLLYPKARVWILLLMKLPLRIPAVAVLGGWIALQVVNLFMAQPEGETTAWWAHIGGFAAGLVLTVIFRSSLLVTATSASPKAEASENL